MLEPEKRHDDRAASAGARKKWIPLAIGAAILLLLLIFGLRSCADDRVATTDNVTTVSETGTALPSGGVASANPVVAADGAFTVEGLRGYLQGTSTADANGQSFGLDRVTFDTGSAQLDAQDTAVINEVAGVLKEFPNAAVTVTGYADPAGDATANKKLAAQRTTAVKQALSAAGIPAGKLMTNVVGETGSAAIPANRRVELLVKR